MASDLFRILPLFAMAAVSGFGTAAVPVRAATGDVLIEYKSSLGTTPENQGWTHEGRSIGVPGVEPSGTRCPGSYCRTQTASPPEQPADCPCWFMGAQDLNYDFLPDNNCLPSIGCRTTSEHYNSPDPQSGYWERIMYTEWLAFDNGDNSSSRPLIIPDSTITHSPPWGAPLFLNAPAYPTLRISTGDGNNVPDTLPQSGVNYRNMGKAKIRRVFEPGTATAFTLVVKAAAGPRAADRHFVEIRAFGRRFAFGVDGWMGSPTYGKITLVQVITDSERVVLGTLFDQTVMVAQSGTEGPHYGEFFTLRLIVSETGMFNAYLNENEDLFATGAMSPVAANPPNEVQLTPIVGDDTMWFDYVRLLEGAVPVSCPDPVVDVNRDGHVDSTDLAVFMECARGPGVPMSNTFACRCADADHDSDVDMADFAVFQRCLTIGGPVGPGCDD